MKWGLKHEGISLFPEIRDTRHISNIKFKQIDKALQYVLDYDEAENIKRKYLNADKPKHSFIYTELSMKKDHFYLYIDDLLGEDKLVCQMEIKRKYS